LLAIEDITDRKRVEEEIELHAAELRRFNQELERSNRELEDFAYVVSHDLRAPLVNIQGFSRELALSCERLRSVLAEIQVPKLEKTELSVLLDEDIPESLEFITTNSAKMDLLLTGVLELSRVGRAPLRIRRLDMNHILPEIVSSVTFDIEQAGASIQVDTLPPCQGDQTQIGQVFSNLLGNALKYRDPNRPAMIRVSGREASGEVVYSVEDNGVGIAAEHRDAIYKIFHRLDPQRGTGEGLGLTIVRRVLERHGGKIWVESEPNKGSTFYVSLPKG
jgi:light-regulated signal transduction histidine kinase (bacteriophytochrome)